MTERKNDGSLSSSKGKAEAARSVTGQALENGYDLAASTVHHGREVMDKASEGVEESVAGLLPQSPTHSIRALITFGARGSVV